MIDRQDSQRRAVLQALLLITAAAGVLFFFINLQRGALVLGAAELFMAVASTLLLWIVRRTERLLAWTLIYLIPFLSVMMLALATTRASESVGIWILLIPVIAHLLLGRRLGLAVSLLFMGMGALIYAQRFVRANDWPEPIAVINVVLCGLVILALSHVFEWSRERSETALRRLATTDPLTGLGNRGKFDTVFQYQHEAAQRTGAPLALLLLDLDHFKRVNDLHGHAGGDAVLVAVAGALTDCIRANDRVYRLGGEEFAVLLTDVTATEARTTAERVRQLIERLPISYGGNDIRITASIGVAQAGTDGGTPDEVYRAADDRLYQSKAAGRNRMSSGAGQPG